MAKRKVLRRARKLLGEEPVAAVWCEVHKQIPKPPRDIHRAAGGGRLKPRRHPLFYVGVVLFFFVVVPMYLLDGINTSGSRGNRRSGNGRTPEDAGVSPSSRAEPFDGDWNLTAGQLLLRWYERSPNGKRLVLLTSDRIALAASPRRKLSPTGADDFLLLDQFPATEARVDGDAGQPRGFATFTLRFADGSWLELGRLAGPEDADRFLRTVSA